MYKRQIKDSTSPSVLAESKSNKDEENAEYLAIYAVFQKFLQDYGNIEDRWDLLEEMMTLRAEFALNHAIKGFGMDFEKALELLRNHNDGLTKLEKEQRNILVAALDNLVDFAVAEEFQMSENLPDNFNITNEVDLAEAENIFHRYNSIYANIENEDIEYAMGIAAGWILYSNNTVLTYMTQGDNRVRPWHLALEGTSYRKASFPAWLIPPIEHGCRCFLVEESADILNQSKLSQVMGQIIEMPDFVNPVFKESVAKGGRIFSDAHSYFIIPKKHKKRLRTIANKIKDKWLEK